MDAASSRASRRLLALLHYNRQLQGQIWSLSRKCMSYSVYWKLTSAPKNCGYQGDIRNIATMCIRRRHTSVILDTLRKGPKLQGTMEHLIPRQELVNSAIAPTEAGQNYGLITDEHTIKKMLEVEKQ
jgi:hypothetical protein